MESNANPSGVHDLTTDQRIGRNVDRFIWWHREMQKTLAGVMGIHPSALSMKLKGQRPWSAAEIDIIAAHYNVDAGVFYSKELPHLDSNQEPIGSTPAPINLDDYKSSKMYAHTNKRTSLDGNGEAS